MSRSPRRSPPAPASAPRGSGQVRIIGGRWRGTKLAVPDRPGLRPSSDRVRETLFNWLGQDLTGLRCLDAFAGSGALGFEAASRGAAEVLLIEQAPALVVALRDNERGVVAYAVPVLRVKLTAFAISGFLAAVAAMPAEVQLALAVHESATVSDRVLDAVRAVREDVA